MTKSEQGPPPEEIASYIEHEARRIAQEAMEGMEFVSLDRAGQELKINAGTPWAKSITLSPEGIAHGPPETMKMPIRAPGNRVFQEAWTNLTGYASEIIAQAAVETFGPQAEAALSTPELRKTLGGAARQACRRTGMGAVNNPTAAGDHLLHQLLGKDKVSEALKIAGAKATIEDFNLAAADRGNLRQAHQADPNATLLWLRAARLPGELPPPPEEIVRRAESKAKEIAQATGCPLDELWRAFRELNRRAVNDIGDPETLALAAGLAAKAGCRPSYSAIKAICRNPERTSAAPEVLLTAFLRESEARKDRRGGTQAEIAEQAESLMELPREELSRLAARCGESWLKWAAKAPRRAARPPEGRKRRTAADREADDARLREILERHIEETGGDGARVAVSGQPGKTAVLSKDGLDIVTFRRTRPGIVRVFENGWWAGYVRLPDTGGEGGNVTTRGAAAGAAAGKAMEAVAAGWTDGERPGPARIAAMFEELAAELVPGSAGAGLDEALSRELNRRIGQLLDAEKRREAEVPGGQAPFLEDYNRPRPGRKN